MCLYETLFCARPAYVERTHMRSHYTTTPHPAPAHRRSHDSCLVYADATVYAADNGRSRQDAPVSSLASTLTPSARDLRRDIWPKRLPPTYPSSCCHGLRARRSAMVANISSLNSQLRGPCCSMLHMLVMLPLMACDTREQFGRARSFRSSHRSGESNKLRRAPSRLDLGKRIALHKP